MQNNKGNITVAGIGPGDSGSITPDVLEAVKNSDVIIGYKYYFQFITGYISNGTECIDTGMRQEMQRAQLAFELAGKGKRVCVISSGDSGIYGMAPLIYEMKESLHSDIEIKVLAGISAFQKAASLLGAPIGHDFCVISLSDLLTGWAKIEKRIIACADADFVTAVYNPKSNGRFWQLYRLKEIFLLYRSPLTPVGYVRNAGREGEQITVTTLQDFNPEFVDMLTIVIIGNSGSFISEENKIITPRGYYTDAEDTECGVGQQIMINSFKTIAGELLNKNIDPDKKWALLHAIHTTADFEMEKIFYSDKNAVADLYLKIKEGNIKTIITDVTMAASGIRKGALSRLGIRVKCYLEDERATELSKMAGITRTQAGIRIAVQEHPDALYVFGNAPTALMELCSLIRQNKAFPGGIIAAPVGFVNVLESKYMVKSFFQIPKLIIEGRKGGSNLAATLVNSILTYDDAKLMRPGKDV